MIDKLMMFDMSRSFKNIRRHGVVDICLILHDDLDGLNFVSDIINCIKEVSNSL